MDKPDLIHTRIRIDFTAGPSIGPGKIALLERIEACGSLSQAARELGLSYPTLVGRIRAYGLEAERT